MADRVTISVPEDAYEEARERKGDRTWAEVLLDGAHADTTAGRGDEGHDEPMPDALTADDVPMLADAVAERVENRLTRR
jgi:hypothetical protein